MDDRALVVALLSGDPRGLAGAYRTYSNRLYTYCRGMLRDPDAAADVVHDTFVLASQRSAQLRDPDRLRPWLYAIARNECLRQPRGRAWQMPPADADDVSAPEIDPATGLEVAEIQELVWAAADGLNPGDREVFELAIRHELPAPEISDLRGVSVAHAHARLSRARSQLERALGALLIARTGAEDCPELAELLTGWDGRLDPSTRKRVSRHIETCEICSERQRRQVAPAALFSGYASAPFLVAPAEIWPRLELKCFDPGLELEREAILRRAGRFDSRTGFPVPLEVARRRRRVVTGVAAVALAALVAAGAGAMIPPIESAAEQPEAAPTQPALVPPAASPSESPSASPSPPPSPTASPSASPSPGPTTEPPPPPPPPTTPAPESGTTTPVALTVAASGDVDCDLLSYSVVVTATANKPLETAQLFVRVGSTQAEPFSMDVDGATASGEAGRFIDPSGGEWWVVVTAGDERAESNVVPIVDPC